MLCASKESLDKAEKCPLPSRWRSLVILAGLIWGGKNKIRLRQNKEFQKGEKH